MALRSINGSNAIIQISRNGAPAKTIGYATGVTVTEAIMLNRIDTLGTIDSKDIEPIGRVVSGSISLMRMTTATDGEDVGGGAASNELTPYHSDEANDITRTKDLMDFMHEGFDLVIIDSADFDGDEDGANPRYIIQGCRPSSHSFALSRGMLMGVNVTFEALRMFEADNVNPTN